MRSIALALALTAPGTAAASGSKGGCGAVPDATVLVAAWRANDDTKLRACSTDVRLRLFWRLYSAYLRSLLDARAQGEFLTLYGEAFSRHEVHALPAFFDGACRPGETVCDADAPTRYLMKLALGGKEKAVDVWLNTWVQATGRTHGRRTTVCHNHLAVLLDKQPRLLVERAADNEHGYRLAECAKRWWRGRPQATRWHRRLNSLNLTRRTQVDFRAKLLEALKQP